MGNVWRFDHLLIYKIRAKFHIKNFSFSLLHTLLSSIPFPYLLPFLFPSPWLWNLRQYDIFKRPFLEWWQWVWEIASWILSRLLSFGGSFVRVPIYSQLTWAPIDELKLCECWVLGLVRAFQLRGCPFLWLKWVRPSRDQVLTTPDKYLKRGHSSPGHSHFAELCRISLSSIICLI